MQVSSIAHLQSKRACLQPNVDVVCDADNILLLKGVLTQALDCHVMHKREHQPAAVPAAPVPW